MKKNQIKLLYNTLFYLKPIQVYYRIYYLLRNKFLRKELKKRKPANFVPITWKKSIVNKSSYLHNNNGFLFLNISHFFNKEIDWNYDGFGKLWTYNLNYFDYLQQKNISKEIGVQLIKNYVKKDAFIKDGKEPYPISLRGINWVKFLSQNHVKEEVIDTTLYNHFYILLKNLEFNLLGNHLLENAFSLLFASYYFQDDRLYLKSKKLLISQLNEQILNDGGHYELSPMYHQILFHRTLDCIQLITLNAFWKKDLLLGYLRGKASLMRSWLEAVIYNNGDIPMVNDSTFGIAPSSKELLKYASELSIYSSNLPLSDSGYRKVSTDEYELFIDVGSVGSDYQPGHSHSDIFNFILYFNNQPIIVDTGTSTYENNNIRYSERITRAHNTVTINQHDPIEVWKSFRVANRADVKIIKESKMYHKASHNGFRKFSQTHIRTFDMQPDKLIISDELAGHNEIGAEAYIHFHDSIAINTLAPNEIFLPAQKLSITFEGRDVEVYTENFKLAKGFNITVSSIMVVVKFKKQLKTTIF